MKRQINGGIIDDRWTFKEKSNTILEAKYGLNNNRGILKANTIVISSHETLEQDFMNLFVDLIPKKQNNIQNNDNTKIKGGVVYG